MGSRERGRPGSSRVSEGRFCRGGLPYGRTAAEPPEGRRAWTRPVDLVITSAFSENLPQSEKSPESQNPCNIEISETEGMHEDP